MLGVPPTLQDGDTVIAAGGRLQTTSERGAGLRLLVSSIVNLIKTGSTARNLTIPDRDLLLRGVSGTQTNARLSKFDTNGDQTDSQIADGVTGNVLTIAGTLTAPRTKTIQNTTATIAELETAETLTGAKTFQNALPITARQGAATDAIILAPANVGSSSNTITDTTPATALGANFIQTRQAATGTVPLIEVQPCASFQNKLINPRFDIWQRGTSFAAIFAGAHSSDRWLHTFDGSGLTTISRQSMPLGTITNDPEYFLRYQVTSAGAGSTFRQFSQRIEYPRTLGGKRCQLTLWAKADAARAIVPVVTQYFGTGGSPSSAVAVAGSTVNLTTGWVQYTQTFILASLAGKTEGTNRDGYLDFTFTLPLNTAFTIDVADIELKEVAASGQVNSPMEIRPQQVELALCQRYCHKTFPAATAPAQNTGSNTGEMSGRSLLAGATVSSIRVSYPVQMRAIPTITFYNPQAANAQLRDITNNLDYSASGVISNDSSCIIFGTANAGSTVNHDFRVHYLATAEL